MHMHLPQVVDRWLRFEWTPSAATDDEGTVTCLICHEQAICNGGYSRPRKRIPGYHASNETWESRRYCVLGPS